MWSGFIHKPYAASSFSWITTSSSDEILRNGLQNVPLSGSFDAPTHYPRPERSHLPLLRAQLFQIRIHAV